MARRAITFVIALIVLFAGGLALRFRYGAIDRELETPRDLHGAPHVTSAACRRCHPGAFESWSRTFHRTMTQDASEAAVLGDFEGATFEYGGIEARMERTEGRGFRMRFVGPDGLLAEAEVVRTVGSRRYQQYLARDDDLLFRLPMAWHVEEGRWFHMNGAFLTPDPEAPAQGGRIDRADYDRHVVRWNDNCVFCHNVAANPGVAGERFETEVAELGIACEACHGPADEHARANADPLRRYALHLADDRADPSIVNPRRLSPERSAAICGRCHGQRITDDIDAVLAHGDPFVPGDDLAEHSRPLARDTTLNGEPGVFAARFWSDGTPRLTAYEYQGLLQSPCDELTCTSCHGMHEGDPRGQIRPSALGDAQCTQCHEDDAHDGHDATSCGSCHMPRVVYGVIGAHPSHRIEVPDPTRPSERPDACSLCHADRSDAWIAREYARRWPTRLTAGAFAATPRLRRDVLAGDPIVRAIAAEALGDDAALTSERARAERVGLLLDVMLEDAYPAVRRIAWRSLARLARDPALAPMAYEPTAGRAARASWVEAARRTLGSRAIPPDRSETATLRAQAATVAISIGE